MEKIWLVKQESNVDGMFLYNVVPCANKETAIKIMKEEIATLLNDEHYAALNNERDRFIIEEAENSYYIEDNYADYYEYIIIEEEKIIAK